MLQSNFKECSSIERMCPLHFPYWLDPPSFNLKWESWYLEAGIQIHTQENQKNERASVLNTNTIILGLDQLTEAFLSEINIITIYLSHCNFGTKPATKNHITTIIITVFSAIFVFILPTYAVSFIFRRKNHWNSEMKDGHLIICTPIGLFSNLSLFS